MKYYFAPLEGITGHVFRCAYDKFFGGIDAYYTPFLTTRDGGIMKNKEKQDILPENNKGLNLIPQIMTKKPDEFIQASKHIAELGYTEINLNVGCPSGTVVPKGKGAGLLRDLDSLRFLLDGIFSGCEIAISIKSRIGFSSTDEFAGILDIYNDYPIAKLILHLRTKEEGYTGSVHPELFEYAMEHSKNPLVYNGDIVYADDIKRIGEYYSKCESVAYADAVETNITAKSDSENIFDGVMIGRGFLSHPGFTGNDSLRGSYTDTARVIAFSNHLRDRYAEVLYGDTTVLHKMKEIWGYLKSSIPDGDDLYKKLKKAKTLEQYDKLIGSITPSTLFS